MKKRYEDMTDDEICATRQVSLVAVMELYPELHVAGTEMYKREADLVFACGLNKTDDNLTVGIKTFIRRLQVLAENGITEIFANYDNEICYFFDVERDVSKEEAIIAVREKKAAYVSKRKKEIKEKALYLKLKAKYGGTV